jgi:CubicO group peptidase (beta-lactamase class C family)
MLVLTKPWTVTTCRIVVAVGLAAALATPLVAGDPGASQLPQAAGPRIAALLRAYNELGRFNGTALVARGDTIVHTAGYGMASFELSVANQPETKQWIGSVTKVFTAAMVMRLVDRGKLSLDSRITDTLPWYRRDTGTRVTVRQLLDHTSGIPDYLHLPGIGREGFQRQVGDDVIEVRPFIERWCSGDLQWEPGSRWGYSNSGYAVLGAIIEHVTGRPFEKALRQLVLDPLGLRDTEDLAMQPRVVVDGLATGYERLLGTLITRRPWNISTAFGAGAMVSTVGDLFRFDRAAHSAEFLSPAARAAMFTAGPGHYGCGWEVQALPIGPGKARRTVVGHEGFIFWSIARVYHVEEDETFVALVNNTGDAPLQAIFIGIADVLYGREPVFPRPSAAEAVQALAAEKGGAAAVARYRELQATAPSVYEFDERGLNGLGYALLRDGKAADAVEIFRFMAESFPQSANAFDSLGEGLAAAGRRDEAIKAYATSLQLNPANTNAAQMLAKLTATP